MEFIVFIKLPKRFMAYKILRMPAFRCLNICNTLYNTKTDGNRIQWNKMLLLKLAENTSNYLDSSATMRCCFFMAKF